MQLKFTADSDKSYDIATDFKRGDAPPIEGGSGGPSGADGERGAKLREAFKLDLQTVALRMRIPMGDLIERQIGVAAPPTNRL